MMYTHRNFVEYVNSYRSLQLLILFLCDTLNIHPTHCLSVHANNDESSYEQKSNRPTGCVSGWQLKHQECQVVCCSKVQTLPQLYKQFWRKTMTPSVAKHSAFQQIRGSGSAIWVFTDHSATIAGQNLAFF